jgi:hypothetical protein
MAKSGLAADRPYISGPTQKTTLAAIQEAAEE